MNRSVPGTGPVIELGDVTLTVAGRRVLDDVSLTVGRGEFAGLIGANGAGKTTLLKVLLGLLQSERGSVVVEGKERARGNAAIGYVPQKIALDPDVPLRARDLVGLGVDGHRYGLPRRSARKEALVAEALAAVGAERFADARVGQLSGGEQQRVMIAHALASRPTLLLLDEPLANLDISSANEVVAVLAGISRTQGVAVVMSAHDVNPLMAVMDRVIYMAAGRVASGPTDEVVRPEVLSRLYRHPVEVLEVRGRILVVAGDAPEDVHH